MTKMTPQNPKMLTVKYKNKEYVEIGWEEKHFAFQVIEDLGKHNTHRENHLVKNESCRNHSGLQGLFIIYVGKVEQVRYH